MRAAPEPEVLAWVVDRKDAARVCATSVTVAEMRYGIARLPAGRRQHALWAAAEDVLTVFTDRVLPFFATAAAHYADVVIQRERAGGVASSRARSQRCPVGSAVTRTSPSTRAWAFSARSNGPQWYSGSRPASRPAWAAHGLDVAGDDGVLARLGPRDQLGQLGLGLHEWRCERRSSRP